MNRRTFHSRNDPISRYGPYGEHINHNLIGGWPHRDFGIVVFSSEVHCADRSLSLSRTSGKFGEIEGERLVVALPLANV